MTTTDKLLNALTEEEADVSGIEAVKKCDRILKRTVLGESCEDIEANTTTEKLLKKLNKKVLEGGGGGVEPPTGTLEITENGFYDVTTYANVEVVTPVAEGEVRSLKKLLDYTKSAVYMFYNNTTITDLTGYLDYNDTENVTNMDSMCSGCKKLNVAPQLNTKNTKNMYAMYAFCNALNTMSPIDMTNNTTAQYMFRDCFKLTEIIVLNSEKLANISYMFDCCSSLVTVKLDMRSVTSNSNASGAFTKCSKLENLTLLNIKANLTIGSGTSYGHLLTLESLLNACQECINVNASRTLTMGTANIAKLNGIYVKLTGEAEADETLPKLPMVQCESTDAGAMTVQEYMQLKGWAIA